MFQLCFYYNREGIDMSITGTEEFASNRFMNYHPEWMKSERYEYCEGSDVILSGTVVEKSVRFPFNMLSRKLFTFFL